MKINTHKFIDKMNQAVEEMRKNKGISDSEKADLMDFFQNAENHADSLFDRLMTNPHVEMEISENLETVFLKSNPEKIENNEIFDYADFTFTNLEFVKHFYNQNGIEDSNKLVFSMMKEMETVKENFPQS